MTKTYRLDLTGGQLRTLHETLSLVLNDPDWQEMLGYTGREWATLGRASDKIMDAWGGACEAESTPAFPNKKESQ